MKDFKNKLRDKMIRLQNKKYQELLKKLYEMFGIERTRYIKQKVKIFDDQSKFNQPKTFDDLKIKRNNTDYQIEIKKSNSEIQSEMDKNFLEMIKTFKSYKKNKTLGRSTKNDSLKIENSENIEELNISKKGSNLEGLDEEFLSNNQKEIVDPKEICVKNAESLSIKDYLKAFAESKCSPITITPGIFSTKLVVQINCKNLEKNSPDLFRTCGWTTCEKKLLSQVPKDEYIIWVPDILDGLNLISMNQAKNDCWVKFFSMPLNKEAVEKKDIANVFQDTWELGWRVRLFGDTEGSDAKNKCGSSAIEYLLPYNISADSLGGSKGLIDGLRLMGYRDGLSLQAMPYDFRMASGLNLGYKKSFKKSLIRLKRLTGKKSIVLAHSFGTINSYSALVDLSKEEKNELVDFWAPVGGPLMGNVQLMSTLITGENPISLFDGKIGISKQQSLRSFYETTFAYEMLPFDYWKFAKEDWFKNFAINRVVRETNILDYEVSRPSFFPHPNHECYKSLENSPVNCHFLKSIFPGKGVIHLKDKNFTISEIPEFLEDLETSYGDQNIETPLNQIYEISTGNYRDYPNPEVPVVGFFYNIKPTPSEYFFEDQDFDFQQKQKSNNDIFQTGDETVETYSQMLPMLKWAYEFAHEEGEDHHPVKFVDLCSSINRKVNPFDSDNHKNLFKMNDYIGLLYAF